MRAVRSISSGCGYIEGKKDKIKITRSREYKEKKKKKG